MLAETVQVACRFCCLVVSEVSLSRHLNRSRLFTLRPEGERHRQRGARRAYEWWQLVFVYKCLCTKNRAASVRPRPQDAKGGLLYFDLIQTAIRYSLVGQETSRGSLNRRWSPTHNVLEMSDESRADFKALMERELSAHVLLGKRTVLFTPAFKLHVRLQRMSGTSLR